MFSYWMPGLLSLFTILTPSALGDMSYLERHCQPNVPKTSLSELKVIKYRACAGIHSRVNLSEIQNATYELNLLCRSKPCLPSLESFTMTRSNLDHLPNRLFSETGLKYLDLSYNGFKDLSSIGPSAATHLKTLILSHNRISTVNKNAFVKLTQLELLDLSWNELKSLENDSFVQLTELRNVTLANNKLSKIDFGLFSPMESLISLDLSGNQLEFVRIGTVKYVNLLQLNVNSNNIHKINTDGLTVSTFPQLSSLDLRNNSFDCSNLQHMLVPFILNNVKIEHDSQKLEHDEHVRRIRCFLPKKSDLSLKVVVYCCACICACILFVLLWISMRKSANDSIGLCEQQRVSPIDLKSYELSTNWVFQGNE